MTFLSDTFGLNNPLLINSYKISLVLSTASCPLLIYKSRQKILSIMTKESYCVISVWLNKLSMINLSFQLLFNIYQLNRTFNLNNLNNSQDSVIVPVFANGTTCLSTFNIII